MANIATEAAERRLVPNIKINFSSPSFKDGDLIPKLYTGDGQDISPPVKWQGAPPNTKSFALICDDPDAPMGTWVHWLIYDIPSGEHQLSEHVLTQPVLPNGSKQGINSFGKTGYGGPAPPPGKTHRYFFKLYALDTVLNLQAGLNAKQLGMAMNDHILAQGRLIGKYWR